MTLHRTLGVLGGMGPYATAAFFQKLVANTPAKKDWDHLRIIVDDNPHIPSRTRSILHGEASPVPGMLESCRSLQAYPVDLITVPCNSAAYFLPEIQPHLDVEVLDIREAASSALAAAEPTARRVGVLGGYVTRRMRTYEAPLANRGMTLVDHADDVQAAVERLIERLKGGVAGEAEVNEIDALITGLRQQHGADAVILACTEFGCLPTVGRAIPVIDSSTALAQHAVARCLA